MIHILCTYIALRYVADAGKQQYDQRVYYSSQAPLFLQGWGVEGGMDGLNGRTTDISRSDTLIIRTRHEKSPKASEAKFLQRA